MRRTSRRQRVKKFILVFFIFAIVMCYYFFVMFPVIKTYTTQLTRSVTEKAVNMAVSNVINRTISYDTLIDINYTNAGEIASFSANQHEINSISREIVKETQFQMNNLDKEALKLNIGTFSGIPFLIGRGPKIALNIIPIGVVSSKFESDFNAVGINMTKHTLYLYVDVHVNIVMPIQAIDVFSVNQVMLAESIIVGKVPEVYLSGGGLKNTVSSLVGG